MRLVSLLTSFLISMATFAQLKAEQLQIETSPSETLKIQLSDSAIKPWLSFNDGEARKAFNTVVHHQALYFSSKLDITPGYIKSWRWDKTNKKYVFEMDTSLSYHDGRKVAARDFEFVLLKPFLSTAATQTDRVPMQFIHGVDKLKVGTPYKSGLAEGVKVIDDKTIEVYLDSGHARFLYALGPLLNPLAPIDQFKDDLYTFKDIPIGCGPYKVYYSDPKSSFVKAIKVWGKGLKYIDFYSEGLGWKNKVDVAFRSGITGMKSYMKKNPGEYQSVQGNLPFGIELIIFNYQNKYAKNETFRAAIAHAFDKQKELPGYPDQIGTDQIIPSMSYGFVKKAPRYNQQKAKALFASLPKDIREATHVISCHGTPNSTDIPKVYLWIKESLEAIGMKVKLVMSEDISPAPGSDTPEMFVFGRYIDPNPLVSFAYFLPGKSSETVDSYPEFVANFEKAEAAESIADRAKYIQEMSKNMEDRNLAIPLHQLYPLYYYNQRLKPLGDNLNAWDINLQNLEIK